MRQVVVWIIVVAIVVGGNRGERSLLRRHSFRHVVTPFFLFFFCPCLIMPKPLHGANLLIAECECCVLTLYKHDTVVFILYI